MTGSKKPWVGGNWKCNGTKAAADTLCKALNEASFDPAAIDVVICAPTLHLSLAQEKLKKSYIISAQNVSKTGNGAYTGETSADMLLDMGINWTLIGHSERRQYYGETDAVVADKTALALKTGMKTAICIGETLQEREANNTHAVLKRQMDAVIPVISNWSHVIIAYEPVWAIGTGKVATPEQAQDAHQYIRQLVKEKAGSAVAADLRIAYGGSVTPDNCKDLFAKPDIDGFLVGGASLKPSFVDIIKSALN